MPKRRRSQMAFAALSVCHRIAFAQWTSLKPDCEFTLRRKRPEKLGSGLNRTLSPVRFEGRTYEIAAISGDSCRDAARFLCSSDCVAERVGFEPTLPFRVNTLSKRAPSATRPSLLRWVCLCGSVGRDAQTSAPRFYGSQRENRNLAGVGLEEVSEWDRKFWDGRYGRSS